FCPPSCPVPFQSPTSIALTSGESWSDHGLFLLSAAVTGQVTLEQHPREVTVREGNSVTIQCSMTRGNMMKYDMSWYRQGPRGTQEWIYYEYGISGDGFQDRFKIRDESLSNRFPLEILAVKPEDAATYFSAMSVLLLRGSGENMQLMFVSPDEDR
uniref:Ig-like domain-containing protein n=1 Tax=Zosterops lateralis melanops TaxID=1220523 RepID=A0A8D2PR54_ZOSLA